MLTVSISINGVVLMARSAVNRKTLPQEDGKVTYAVDDGSQILHNPDDGAVALAHKLLDTIKE